MKKKSSLAVLVVLVGLVGVTGAWQQTQKPQAPPAKAPAKSVARKPALVLNEDSAKSRIQDAQRSERYLVSFAAIAPLFSQSTTDYRAGASDSGPAFIMKRLIDGGIVRQDVRVESYPVISGSWTGGDTCVTRNNWNDPSERLDFILKNRNTSCFSVPLTMQLQTVANSNRITGTSNRTSIAAYADAVTGTVTPKGEVTFDRLDGPTSAKGSWTYIERGQRAYLVNMWDYLFSGTASGRTTEVKTFNYAIIPNAEGSSGLLDSPSTGKAEVGMFEVGAVSNLLLTTETRASANFAWQVTLDKLGHILLGDVTPSGIGRADFAKKPDGTWVLVPPIRF